MSVHFKNQNMNKLRIKELNKGIQYAWKITLHTR